MSVGGSVMRENHKCTTRVNTGAVRAGGHVGVDGGPFLSDKSISAGAELFMGRGTTSPRRT